MKSPTETTIELDNESEQTLTIEIEAGRLVLVESCPRGSTRMEMSNHKALELAVALIKATMAPAQDKPYAEVGAA